MHAGMVQQWNYCCIFRSGLWILIACGVEWCWVFHACIVLLFQYCRAGFPFLYTVDILRSKVIGLNMVHLIYISLIVCIHVSHIFLENTNKPHIAHHSRWKSFMHGMASSNSLENFCCSLIQ